MEAFAGYRARKTPSPRAAKASRRRLRRYFSWTIFTKWPCLRARSAGRPVRRCQFFVYSAGSQQVRLNQLRPLQEPALVLNTGFEALPGPSDTGPPCITAHRVSVSRVLHAAARPHVHGWIWLLSRRAPGRVGCRPRNRSCRRQSGCPPVQDGGGRSRNGLVHDGRRDHQYQSSREFDRVPLHEAP